MRKFIQAKTAREQAEAGAEGQARQSRAERSGAWRSGEQQRESTGQRDSIADGTALRGEERVRA